jgi:2-polyprenyl-3-methyl-5-hydroxy-6-metoxy-1,4-benzoquinol methylase
MEKYKDHDHNIGEGIGAGDGSGLEMNTSSRRKGPGADHSPGFKVFLDDIQVREYDEYNGEDPYSVEKALDSPFHRRRGRGTIRLTREALKKSGSTNNKILDIGCGEGHITELIKNNFPNCEISALDCSITAIKKAVSKYQGIDFIVADACHAPYTEGYFDVVICNNLWEHVPDPIHLLEQIRKITKDKGWLILSTPSRYRFSNIVRIMLRKPIAFMSPYHVTEYSLGQVMEQLKYGGYGVEEVYTEPINPEGPNRIRRCFMLFLISCFRVFGKMVNRPHDIESTVFFLARRK